MSDAILRQKIIRLAYERPDLREQLLPLVANEKKAAVKSQHVDDALSYLLVGGRLNQRAMKELEMAAQHDVSEREALLGIKCWIAENEDAGSGGARALNTIIRAQDDVGQLPLVPVNRLQDGAAYIAELLDQVFADR